MTEYGRLPLDLAALGTYFEAHGHEVRTAHLKGDDDAIEIILQHPRRLADHRDIIYIDHYKHRWRITHRFNFIEVLIDPAEPNAIEQLEAELNRYQLLR